METIFIKEGDNLQEKIDEAILKSSKLVIKKGLYETTPLFIKGALTLEFEEGATLLATTNEALYQNIKTRVAGIEMEWYPALLNVIGTSNVTIKGQGILDGNGPYWWNKYWGLDMKGGYRKIYDEKGLRFAADYDCKRPRNLLVQNSSNVKIYDITSTPSGFWNIHILYSNDILIENVKIKSEAINSPSTDGIDIDSSYNVVVNKVETNCNDDSVCIKSGRDFDGIRVGRPSHDITISNSIINKGFGVTIGSEISGGVYNVNISNLKYYNTDCGFRIKSSYPRKGYINDVKISNLEMTNVKYLFHMCLNWNPNYSICKMPPNYNGPIYPHYEVLTHETAGANTRVSDILIDNVNAYNTDDYKGISRIFNLEGFSDMPISNITFKNVKANAKEFGYLYFTKNINFIGCSFSASEAHFNENDDYDNR